LGFFLGVNKYKLEKEELIQVLQIDNKQVREQQIEKIKKVKQTRDQSKVDKCLEKLREIARDKSGSGNLLEASIEAARARCTLGEISQALEDVFSRHVADSRLVSGAYRKTFDDGKDNNELKQVIDRVEVCRLVFFSFFLNYYLNRNFPKSMVDVLEYL
jgi:methylmalonyl-CoA mutase